MAVFIYSQSKMKDLHYYIKPAILGVILLLAGIFFYLVDRPPDRIYFIQQIGTQFSLFDKTPLLFGKLGDWFPTFAHVTAFSLLTAAFWGGSRKRVATICTAWAGINILMELGQKYKAVAIDLTPAWFSQIPGFKNTAPYFQQGSFDRMDILAAVMGAVAAYILFGVTTKTPFKPNESAQVNA